MSSPQPTRAHVPMRCPPPPVLCILLELAQVPRMLRIEGHTHRAQERAELFPLISFPNVPTAESGLWYLAPPPSRLGSRPGNQRPAPRGLL